MTDDIKKRLAKTGLEIKPLVFDDGGMNDNSFYAPMEFGPISLYYNIDLVDEQFDIWEVEIGSLCSELVPTMIHKGTGLEPAKQAVQDHVLSCVLAMLQIDKGGKK